MNKKWIVVIILVVIAAIAAFVAIEYFTTSIHGLPSYIPGQKPHARGHYRKRGAGAALVAFVLLVIAGIMSYRIVQEDKLAAGGTGGTGGTAAGGAPAGTADQILSSSPTTPESPPQA